MKLVCLNVGLFEENNDKLKTFLKKQNPDFIALQEVTRRIDKTAFEKYVSKDSIDELTKDLTYSFFSPNWTMDGFEVLNFHSKKLFKIDLGGFVEFGNYIKSRYKITLGRIVFTKGGFTLITEEYWNRWPENDCKSFQLADISLGSGKKIRILNYHGIWSKDKKDSPLTIKAAETIKNLALEVDYPVIICGDFNLFPDTKSMKVLSGNFVNLVDKFNIQTTRPKSNELSHLDKNIVDYIFVSKGIKVNNFEVLQSDVSDHLPLILDFEV